MGRPRKPTNVIELNGGFRKNPQRRRARANEPVPTAGIGPAPKHLNTDQAAAWDEIVGMAAPGVLMCSDRIAVEIAAVLIVQQRQNPVEFTAARLNVLTGILGRLGFSPSDRSRVVVPRGKGRNPFDGF